MQASIIETREAIDDVVNLAKYMIDKFKNASAAGRFVNEYEKQIELLSAFPFSYGGIGIEYRGYEIRIKPFDTYNLFFVVDTENETIIILRVLKNLQNWQKLIRSDDDYHF